MKHKEAVQLLEECERGLRRLLSEAAVDGDYAGVNRIADLARAISALAADGRLNPEANPAPAVNTSNAATAGAPAAGRKSRSTADEYPKFYRRGDELVKVGWSKSKREQYHHRAPRPAVDAVAAAVKVVGARNKIFNGDALLPLKNPAGGPDIAAYQSYVALAWLKHLGIVKQHGRRGGYTLVPEKQIESTIAAAWPELAEWRG